MSLMQNIDQTNTELIARIFGSKMINPKDRYKKLEIDDIPVMITNNKKIVCIPKTSEVKHIGVVGMTGSAKTVYMNALLHWDYWSCERDCIFLNDIQKETFEWSMPTFSYLPVLRTINIKPYPTPLVYVFPATESLELENIDRKFPHIKMTLPIEEVIKHIEHYHALDKSKLYLGNILESLAKCTSMEEIQDLLQTEFPDKGQKGMRFKMQNIFQDLFNNKILDVSVPEAPAYLDYIDKFRNTYYNLTIQTLMRAGLVPSIQTYDLSNYPHISAYISFIIESIHRNQYDDPYFRKRTVSLFVDEIDKLYRGENGDIVKSSLNKMATNGRAARIGLRWATQAYGQVTEQIKRNTRYLIVLRMKDSKDVKEIKKDFDIPPEFEKDMLNLKTDTVNGKFEAIITSTEKLKVYDLETGKITDTLNPQRGFIIPSPARHHVPNIPIAYQYGYAKEVSR